MSEKAAIFRSFTRSAHMFCWLLAAFPLFNAAAFGQVAILDLATVRPSINNYFELLRFQNQPYGVYRMTPSSGTASNYATLDAAISRTIMGENFQTSLTAQQRTEWIGHIQSFARPDGTYSDTYGHNQLHANGMTISGLGPLGGKQQYPAGPLYAPFDTVAEATVYLDTQINWSNQWGESHKFWGGLDMFSHSSAAPTGWTDAVFTWLDAGVDPVTGWFKNPSSNTNGLGGGAHIWPIYEQFGHAFPQPERVIDTVLSMQNAAGNFAGAGFGSYMNLDALYALRFMRDQAPGYRTAEINSAVELHGQWMKNGLSAFLGGNPAAHPVLAVAGDFGLLNQLAPTLFPDSTGAHWSDIFTDPKLYQTAAVETFTFPPVPNPGRDGPSNYSNRVLTAAPVGYWRIDQTAGVKALEAQNKTHLDGIYNALGTGSGAGNLAQAGPRPAAYPGMTADNHVAHLNGSTSYVYIPDHADLDITGELTIEAWINLDRAPSGANAGILAKYLGDGNNRSYNLYVEGQNGTKALALVVSPDGTFTNAANLVDDQPLAVGQWLHVAGTFKPNQFLRLYIDGNLVREMTTGIPSQIFNSTADLWIGTQYNTATGGNHFPGRIDEAAVYNRALSLEEIKSHYQTAFVLEPGSLNWIGGNAPGPTNWELAANWNPAAGVPDAPGAKVSFGFQSSDKNVVDMISAGRTVGSIAFAAFTGTTIRSTGGFNLTLDNLGSASLITVEGTHTITAPLILNNDAVIAGSGTLNVGSIVGNHALSVSANLMAQSITVASLTIGGSPSSQVPEPSAFVLLGTVVVSFLAFSRRGDRT